MPPPLPDSDSESLEDEPAAKVDQIKAEDENMDDGAQDDVQENAEGDEDEDDGDEEVYIVEKIQEHRSDFEDGKMRYLVKWKGYEAKKDRTWEPEENLEGAKDVLDAYFKSLGGKPVAGAEKVAKKRGRQSTSGTKTEPEIKAKKPRMSKGGRRSNGLLEQDVNPNPNVGYTEIGEDDWKPPPVKDGAWDPLVQSVDTVVRENSDGELWAYLIWNEKSDSGRFYRSKAKLPTIYKACPQRMLHFYEKHLVFQNAGEEPAAGE